MLENKTATHISELCDNITGLTGFAWAVLGRAWYALKSEDDDVECHRVRTVPTKGSFLNVGPALATTAINRTDFKGISYTYLALSFRHLFMFCVATLSVSAHYIHIYFFLLNINSVCDHFLCQSKLKASWVSAIVCIQFRSEEVDLIFRRKFSNFHFFWVFFVDFCSTLM